MEDNQQYKQADTEGTVRLTQPAQVTTRTPVDIKIQKLEEQLASQHQTISKLRRDIARLKSDIGDIVTTLKNRG